MATLTGQSIASSYEQLLHVDTDGGGNTTTLVPIKDGDNGTTFAAQLSTTTICIDNPTTSSSSQGGILRLQSDDGAALGDTHRLGVIEFGAAEDGSNTITTGARIEAIADAAWSASENGADMVFYTTDGNASQSEQVRISATGVLSTKNINMSNSSGNTTISISAGADEGDAVLLLKADAGAANADWWEIRSDASDNNLYFKNGNDERAFISAAGDVTFTGDLKINNANYAVEGYGTGRNVLRSLRLKLENATTAGNYVKATTFNKFNHTPIAEADDVLLGTPKTNFSYPLAWVFDILVAGLEGNCIGVLSASVQENQSGTALTVVGDVNSNGIRVSLLNAASAAGADIDSLVDTGQISIQVLYVTSS